MPGEGAKSKCIFPTRNNTVPADLHSLLQAGTAPRHFVCVCMWGFLYDFDILVEECFTFKKKSVQELEDNVFASLVM